MRFFSTTSSNLHNIYYTTREFRRDSNYNTDAERDRDDTGFPERGSYVLYKSEDDQKSDANWHHPYFKQSDKHPVVCVSWNDAIAYCNWRSRKEGLTPVYTINGSAVTADFDISGYGDTVTADFKANGYRLPTEAEWEYAARCGKKGYKYSWGDGEPSGKRGGNIADETFNRKISDYAYWEGYDDGYVYTAPVGSFDPNEFGLYDMTGNVGELCWDSYDEYYYKYSPYSNPLGTFEINLRTVRGGGWVGQPWCMRAAFRGIDTSFCSDNHTGFRLSRTY